MKYYEVVGLLTAMLPQVLCKSKVQHLFSLLLYIGSSLL